MTDLAVVRGSPVPGLERHVRYVRRHPVREVGQRSDGRSQLDLPPTATGSSVSLETTTPPPPERTVVRLLGGLGEHVREGGQGDAEDQQHDDDAGERLLEQGVCTLQVLVDHPRKCNLVDIDAAVAVGVEGLGGGQDEER